MRISSAEFVRKFSLLCDEALTQPLIISRHGRDRLVVMSLAMYREVTTPPDAAKQALPEHAAPLPTAKPDSRKDRANGRSRPRTEPTITLPAFPHGAPPIHLLERGSFC
jgi:PHD/YefM family antitoxin component YafN of YafNO toxin-antitoxin module